MDVDRPEWQFIYCLKDPRTMEVRYVGCCTNPYYCEKRHHSLSKSESQPRLHAWKTELRQAGLKAIFKILCKVQFGEAHRRETIYIRSYAEALGEKLLNKMQRRTVEESFVFDAIQRRKYRDRRAAEIESLMRDAIAYRQLLATP